MIALMLLTFDEVPMRSHIFRLLLALCLISGQGAALADEKQTIDITIGHKDCLINICKQYLEHPEQWPTIARLNNLADPNRLSPGQTLKLPVDMLKGIPVNGTVSFIKGTVSAKTSAQTTWQPLRLHDAVAVGSDIKTGPDSAVELSFTDGTVLLMRADSSLKVSTSKMSRTHVLRRIYLQAGKVISNIKAATGRENRYEIQTPSSRAAARGTEYRVSVDDRLATRAEVLEGIVDTAAMGQKVTLNRNEGTLVRMNAPPLQPSRLLPPPEAIGMEPLYRKLPLTVRFSKVEGAAAYSVVLTRDPAANDIIRGMIIKPDELLEVGDLAEGSYYLSSYSIDAIGLEGSQSAPAALRLTLQPPQPVISAPAKDASLRSREVAFTWQKEQNASGYHLQIAADSEFRRLVVDAAAIRETGYTTGSLPFGAYHCRLRATAEDGFAGEWSAPQRFSLVAPPAAPQIEKLAIEGKDGHISWGSLGDGITYHVQVARDEEFKDITTDTKLEQLEITVEPPPGASIFYVRIRGIDRENYAGDFSEPQSIVSKTRFPLEFFGVFGVLLLLAL